MVLNALADTYDTVLLEFGAADIEGVTRLLKYIDAEVVVSLPDGDDQLAGETLLELRTFGYSEVIVMGGSHSADRTAA
jgi:hypothetical protein